MERTKETPINEHGLPNIVIPAEVLMNTDLSPREMILFGHLMNMTYNEYSCCWASNRYLSRLIGVAPETISTMISKLVDYQYLILEYETRYDGSQVRRIFINKKYPEIYAETLKQAFKQLKGPIRKNLRAFKENLNGPKENKKGPLRKSLNNIDNNIDNDINYITYSEVCTSESENNSSKENNYSTQSKNKPTPKERAKEYLPQAESLKEVVQSEKNIKINQSKLNSWANEIRKLVETDGVELSRINKVLDWYSKNIGGEYIPVVESGSALRNKFLRLEDAMTRENSNGVNKSKGRKPSQGVRSGRKYHNHSN